MARRKRQSGFTLLEALMASGLLAMAAAGILLPLTAAAASQTDAQRRVVATRFAADVIERCIAGQQDLDGTVSAVDLGYSESTYKHITAVITSEVVFEDELILLTVEAFDGDRSITTLKTLAAAAGPAD